MPSTRIMTSAVAFLVTLSCLQTMFVQTAFSHCEVPCGVYGDTRRFEEMLEDQVTIEKAMVNINQLADKHDAQSANQMVRWINTKEAHASNVQKIMSQYFLTQRVKATSKDYVPKLVSAHAVIVAAMKCKQSTTAENAATLKKAIKKFHAVYAGEHAHGHNHGHSHKHDDHVHKKTGQKLPSPTSPVRN